MDFRPATSRRTVPLTLSDLITLEVKKNTRLRYKSMISFSVKSRQISLGAQGISSLKSVNDHLNSPWFFLGDNRHTHKCMVILRDFHPTCVHCLGWSYF